MSGTAICVLGMHRSGTSALAGVLHRLGVDLGARLVPAQSGVNERGFWEHDDVVDVHNRLLRALGSFWDEVRPLPPEWWNRAEVAPFRDELRRLLRRDFAGAALWGVKDPRLCRLVPLWFELLAEFEVAPVFLHVWRKPMEVARSLHRRDRMTPEKAVFLWLDYNLAAEAATRGRVRTVVRFDDLVAHPGPVMTRVAGDLGVRWPAPPERAEAEIAAFLSADLRHHRGDDDDALLDRIPGARNALLALEHASAGRVAKAETAFEAAAAAHAAYVAGFDPVLVGHIVDLQRRGEDLRTRLRVLRGSFAWRMTKPLRLFTGPR